LKYVVFTNLTLFSVLSSSSLKKKKASEPEEADRFCPRKVVYYISTHMVEKSKIL